MWRSEIDKGRGVMAPRASGPDQNDEDVNGGTGTGTGTVVKARPKTNRRGIKRLVFVN